MGLCVMHELAQTSADTRQHTSYGARQHFAPWLFAVKGSIHYAPHVATFDTLERRKRATHAYVKKSRDV